MKKIALFVLLACLAPAGMFTACSREASRSAAAITLAGSTSVNPLMEQLIAAYQTGPGSTGFNVSATGSGDGIKAASSGTAEIGMSSRELSAAEKGTGIDEHLIAVDGIAVIVNPGSRVTNLRADQIRDIYTGRITDWGEIEPGAEGRIAVVSREPGSGTRGAFEEILQFQDKLVKGAVEFDGAGAIKAEISRNADAVGYISLGSVDGSVKALSVDGAAPSAANVVNGSYRLARPFLLLTKKGRDLRGETRAFLDWILSPAGQEIVKKNWIGVK